MSGKITAILKTAACAAVCLLFVTGCSSSGSGTRGILWYQDCFRSVTLEGESRTWQITRRADGMKVKICAPQSAAGICFTLTDGTATVSSGSLTIPLSDRAAEGVRRITAFLTLSDDSLTGVDAGHKDDPNDAVCAHYRVGIREYTVGINLDGLPVFFEEEVAGCRTRYTVTALDMTDNP